ncbi:MAG: arginine--tRNA ligase, partial [Gammaproteobacteria bacterium]
MKQILQALITDTIKQLQQQGKLPIEIESECHIERARDKQHGDFACNIAMVLAKQAKKNPRQIAEMIIAALPSSDQIKSVSLAGPGFINFFMAEGAYHAVIKDVLSQKETFGDVDIGKGEKIHIEYISANPTGPLHVGHGRSAAYGASLADLLAKVGYQVYREYYVNDAGRQMSILMVSVWLRYLQLLGEDITFPVNAYQGEYVQQIATQLQQQYTDKFYAASAKVQADLPADETQGGDKEKFIDALILRAKQLLNDDHCQLILDFVLNKILTEMREDLAEFGIEYQQWFSEKSLLQAHAVSKVIDQLNTADLTYEKDGALWFNATAFGDEKDRVLIRANQQLTYFASDIAYHADKFARGYNHIIDVFGADHHGYVTRIQAAMTALGHDHKQFEIRIVQFATLYEGKQRIQMSTRSGSFVTLRQLRDEVGRDAARFFYVMRKSEQHMDFDLELAKSQSNENPVYYIQYAHARICSVMRQLADKKFTWDQDQG